jgi:hypothetical protein
MAVYSSEQLKRDIEGAMANFQNPVAGIEKEFAKVVRAQQEVIRTVQESRTLLETAKAFLKDPKKEGIRIVLDALRAADKFFANLFKLLTKDIGAMFLKYLAKLNAFILAQLLKLATSLKTLNNALRLAVIKELVKLSSRLEKGSSKVAQTLAKLIQANAARLIRDLLKSFDKSVGPASNLFKTLGKNSQALVALKEVPKAMGTLVVFAKAFTKLIPILGGLADLRWKNDTTAKLTDIERKIRLNSSISDRQFTAVLAAVRRIESSTKGGQELGTIARNSSQTLSEIKAVKAAVQQGSTKSDAIQASINRAGAQNYGPQLQNIQNTLNAVSTQTRSPQQQQVTIDYSRIQSSVASALSGLPQQQQQTPIDYARIQGGVVSALSGLPQQQQQTPIDYARIQGGVASALATFKPVITIPSEIVRKSDLTDLAKRSDVEAIPSLIKQPDLSSILSAVTVLNGGITRLGSDIARNTVNLQPIQQQLTSLSSQLLNMPTSIANTVSNNVRNTVNNLGNTITNNVAGAVSNIVNNNNQTIINNIGKGLDVSTIINPIKTHIDTQVGTPLKTTMQVLNVNDLQKGMSLSSEALIKQAGTQQYGTNTVSSSTATNLVGLVSAIAAPLFFRAGFQKLGGSFDQSVMHPEKGKVKMDDALSASLWTFKQVDERLGLANTHSVKAMSGAMVQVKHKNIHDGIEEINANTITQGQDLEVIERYVVAVAQDVQKLMQITLQTREDVDLLIDDSGCKFEEVKKSHPSHLKLTAPGKNSSLLDLFQTGQVHYVARQWKGNADKCQILERIGLDTQIAAMSNKFEMPDVSNIQLPLDKSTARKSKAADDETWKIFVSTMEEPPAGYGVAGNPVPNIKEIKTGTVREITKPTNPNKKLGQ